jgi:hypothetical protein
VALDPISLLFAAAPWALEALKHFRNQNEARRFFYTWKGSLSRNEDIPHEIRGALADRLFYLLADPNFRSPLDDYLGRLDSSAVPELEEFVRNAVAALADTSAVESVTAAAMRDLQHAINRAKKSDRDALLLQSERTLSEIQDVARRTAPVALLDVDWAPDWPQRALRKLGKEAPGELVELRNRVGTGEDPEKVTELISEPDPWTAQASEHTWEALARFAEHHGEWLLARRAWQRALAKTGSDSRRVTLHVQMAMNAGIAGDDGLYNEEMTAARAIDPHHPRVRLEDVIHNAHSLGPEKVLAELADLSFDDPVTRAVVEAQRALAYLLIPDVASARRHVEAARVQDADILQVQMVEACVVIHENRVAVTTGTPIDAAELEAAAAKCLEIRERLLRQRRPEESARLLMLAADSSSFIGDREKAAELLRSATDEERFAGVGDEALADAALRALDEDLAVALLHPDKPDNDCRRRIRAQAAIISDTADHAAAGAELDDLVESSESERHNAAVQRLLGSVVRRLDWSARAEEVLRDEYRREAVLLKVAWLTERGRFEEVEPLLAPDLHESWAREALFKAAARSGQFKVAAEAAKQFLERHTPSQDLRLQFGFVFADTGDLSRARAELRAVADDARAPADSRARAFGALSEITYDTGDRFDLLQRWKSEFPDDPAVAVEFARLARSLQ